MIGLGIGSKPLVFDQVHAIVVTYHPNRHTLVALLDATERQVDRVLVVDNGSAESQTWLREIGDARGHELLLLDQNVGVAAAHNLGIAKARALGADAVLLLDQDSLPAQDMVRALRQALADLHRSGKVVAAVGPCHVDQRSLVASPFVQFGFLFNTYLYCGPKQGRSFVQCDHLITSGTLIPAASLDAIGGFDEGLFIDNVDTEWCFRAKARGYELFGVCSARMQHALGEALSKTWVPFAHDVVVHRPARLYYIVRNHVLLYRRRYTPNAWIVQDVPRLMFKVVMFATSFSPRLSNLMMMMKGFRDGMRGKTGPDGSLIGL